MTMNKGRRNEEIDKPSKYMKPVLWVIARMIRGKGRIGNCERNPCQLPNVAAPIIACRMQLVDDGDRADAKPTLA